MELGVSCICSFLCSPSLPTLQGPSPTGVWKSSSPAKLCPHTLPIGPWSLLRAKGINDRVQSVTLPSGGQARGNGPCRPWEPVLQPQVTREWARRKSTGSVQTWPLGPVDSLQCGGGVWPDKGQNRTSETTAQNRASEFCDRLDVGSAG